MKTSTPRTFACSVAVLCLALAGGGCNAPAKSSGFTSPRFDAEQTLHPGDAIRVAFSSTPGLDTTQQIRRDGKLNLPLVGEVRAADRAPAELQQELRELYSKQLVTSDVTVTVTSSPFTVFVSGAVLRPGRISPERAVTALEAVMEAGGFDPAKANPRAVAILRTENNHTQRITIDLKAVIDGTESDPFYLKPYDIVFVPERFAFF